MPKLNAALIERNAAIIAQANPLYEQINQNWEKVEAFLKARGVLAPVSYWYDHDENGQEFAIGIHKMSGKWRVCAGYSHHSDPNEEETWTPISDVGIELRVALLDQIPALFGKLVESNENAVKALEEAAKKSSETLKALGIS